MLDKDLIPLIKNNCIGFVIDIGAHDSPYKKYMNYTSYRTLDNDSSKNPDIFGDITKLPKKYYGLAHNVVMTEVLEHLYDPKKALKNVYKLLDNNGVVIASTRFVYPTHGVPHDYYRFTEYSLRKLFKDFDEVEIKPHGNRFQACIELMCSGSIMSYVASLFSPLICLIDYKDFSCPCGFTIIAKKVDA